MERDVDKRLSATQALQHSWLQTKVPNQFDENMAKKALNNLTLFRAETKLKLATVTYMASHLASKKDQVQLRETFKMFDKDGNG